MKKRKRKKGEQEVRILPDGRVVLVAPDQALLDVGQTLASETPNADTKMKRKDHGR